MDALTELFYSPETGFCGLKQLLKLAKENKLKLSSGEITEWYKNQSINQVFRKDYKTSNIPFYAKKVGQIQADLIDISLLARKNDNYKWILTVIDVKTRFAWAFPLKKKNPAEILEKFYQIQSDLKNVGKDIVTLTVDDGGEFKGVVKAWCKSQEIPIWIANPTQNTKGRTGLVEGYNRTLLRKMFKWMKSGDNYRWVEFLDDFVKNTNSEKSLKKSFLTLDLQIIDPFDIGDFVRIILPRTIFSKPSREPSWSDKVYRILTRDHARYKLTDDEFKVLPLAYLPKQLQKVSKHSNILDSNSLKESQLEKRIVTKQRQSNLDMSKVIGHEKEIAIPKRLVVTGKRKAKIPSRFRD